MDAGAAKGVSRLTWLGREGGCGVPFNGDVRTEDGGNERENNGNKFKSGVAAGV